MLRTLVSGNRPAHAIDDLWRARVRRALENKGWEQLDLAKAVGCSPSIISDLLSGKKNQSPYLPDIHTALGWSPPNPPVFPEETDELMQLWQRLDDIAKGSLLERARLLYENSKKK